MHALTRVQETYIKNQVLMEEWREQRGSVEEGVKTALERLDPEEESKLQVL